MVGSLDTFADSYKANLENGETDYGVYVKEFQKYIEIYGI